MTHPTPAGTNTEPLTEAEYDLLVFLEQYWWEHSTIPTKALMAELGMDEVAYTSALRKPAFTSALIDRGVDRRLFITDQTGPAPKTWRDHALTEEQLTAINIMLDLKDNRSQRKKLQELGIPTQRWEAWIRDPVFQNYLRSRAENLLGDNQHEAHLALLDRVRAGELPAIKYFNEITGRYVPVSAAAASGAFDVKMVLIRVVEILQKYLMDEPDRLELIAGELIALAENANPAPVVLSNVRKPETRTLALGTVKVEPKSIDNVL